MKVKIEQFPARNSNPVLNVANDGVILYSNEAGEPLLNEWGVRVRERLPAHIRDFVKRVISQNSPEKIEVNVGNKVYLVVFSPLPERKCVNISGFDISDQKRLDEKPHESEEKYQKIFNLIEEGIAICELVLDEKDQPIDVIILEANPAYEKHSGRRREQVIGRPLKDILPTLEHIWLDRCGKVTRTRTGTHFEEYNAFLDKYFEIFACPMEDNCFIAIYSDTTERKQNEKALLESEEKYRIIADNTYDWEFWLDPDNRFLYTSPSCKRVTGYAAWEFIDNSYLLQEIIHPDDRQAFLQHQHDMPSSRHGDIEFRIVTKDGEIRWIHHLCQPLYDGEGRYAGTRGSNRDITERKRVEEEIQGASNMLQLIMDNIPQGIFWKDCNSRYLGCNKVFAKAAGLESPESIIGKTDYDLPWSPEQTEWFREYDRKIMENDTPEYHIIEQQTTADGKLTWLDTNKIPLHDAKGNVIGILDTYEDITERKEAEESLRLLNLYNRSLIETSLDPLVTIGHDGKITDVNKATEQVTGYSRNELIGTDFSDYFTEPEKAKKGYQKVFDEGFVIDYELEIRNKNGKETSVLYNASEYKDESGNVIGVFAAARDITESKKAKEVLKKAHGILERKVKERTAELEKAYNSLKESEKGLAEAQRMAHIGNWVWDIETDKAYWSNELYRIFGRDPQKLAPTIDEFHSYIHPDDRHDYVNLSNKALEEKSSLCTDFRIISDDGEERRVYLQSKIILNETNDPIQIKGIVRDITESKKAEEKIHHLANIVESSEDAIGTLTLDGTIISWNKGAEQVYGYSVDEILGKCVSILAQSHLDKETIKLIEKIKQREQVNNYETLRLRKDGKSINVSITLSPVFDTSGELTNVSFITRDITKRKEAEEALAKIEIARKQEIHHRIKNNLQVISSLLDLQAEKFRGKKKIEDSNVLEAFKESQDRVISMALIHEELHKGVELDTLNISNYIEELADNLLSTYRVGNNGITLDTDVEEDIFFDMDTSVPLGIIINELISNSLKHAFPCSDKGEIRIKLHREENGEGEIEDSKSTTFILLVADNGVGIPEDFDIEDTDSLGLQLVTTLVDQLDGELELRRDNGTKFTIRFMVRENSNSVSVPTTQQSF